jgi:hypothetical protein
MGATKHPFLDSWLQTGTARVLCIAHRGVQQIDSPQSPFILSHVRPLYLDVHSPAHCLYPE